MISTSKRVSRPLRTSRRSLTRCGDGALTANPNSDEYLGVPWACFFHTNGVAFHGAYWHNNFGAPTSQGCVNLDLPAAHWLFRWCTPTYQPGAGEHPNYKTTGQGTRVIIY